MCRVGEERITKQIIMRLKFLFLISESILSYLHANSGRYTYIHRMLPIFWVSSKPRANRLLECGSKQDFMTA